MTNQSPTNWRGAVCAIGLLVLAPVGAFGQAPAGAVGPEAPSAITTNLDLTSISWQPQFAFSGGVLRVNGPDGPVLRRAIEPGGDLTYRLVDGDGAPLGDGHYTFEIRLTRVTDLEAAGAAIQNPGDGDGAAIGNTARVSGRFEIRNGSLVVQRTPTLADAAGGRSPSVEGPIPQVFDHIGTVTIDGKLVVGFDTTIPLADIFVVCENDDGECPGDIRFQQHTTGVAVDAGTDWAIQADFGNAEFRVRNGPTIGTTTDPLTIEQGAPSDSLYIAATGRIGMRTATPSHSIDLAGELFPQINFTSTDTTEATLQMGAGEFIIEGQTEQDIVIVDVLSAPDTLLIDPTGVTMSSSRTVKKNIEPATPSTLLEQLAQLPIYTWSYVGDSTDTVHVGPMAEDFYHRFGVGSDEKRISTLDTSGVALAAIQALNAELADRGGEITVLETELAELKLLVQGLVAAGQQ